MAIDVKAAVKRGAAQAGVVVRRKAAARKEHPMITHARLDDAMGAELLGVIEEAMYDHIKHQWAADGWPYKMAREQARAAERLIVKWLTQR